MKKEETWTEEGSWFWIVKVYDEEVMEQRRGVVGVTANYLRNT